MKTKTVLWFVAISFAFLLSNSSSATHLIGGEITWECHPTNGKYRIIAKLYKECGLGAVGLPATLPISLSNGSSIINLSFISSHQINPNCYSTSGGFPCGSTYGSYEVGIFRSAWITITSIPAIGLELSWGSCCRTSAVTNLSTLSFGLRAKMYPPVSGGTSCNNNPPMFMEDPLVRACVGEQTNFNPMLIDQENDSLFVELASPINSNGANGIYYTGYSFFNPFPDLNKNPLNNSLLVDPFSGSMSFKSYTSGLFVGVYKIEEWRQGVLLSETYRDAPTLIGSCTAPIGNCPQGPNNAPTILINSDTLQNPNSPIVSLVSPLTYEVNASVGDTIDALITSIDLDINPNCLPQNIQFAGSGSALSKDPNYSNPSLCFSNGPCATLASLNTGGGYGSVSTNAVSFEWAISQNHLTYQGLQKQKMTYVFNFKVMDDACPIPSITNGVLKVNIEDNTPGPPSLSKSCVNIVAANGDISFNAIPAVDTADVFHAYYVYHSTNKTGPYLVIDTVSIYSISGYTDFGRGPGPNYYFLRTVSTMLSPTSDTLSLMNLNIQPSSGTPTVVTLNWNAHSSNQNTNIYYQVWKRDSLSASWVILDSTQSLTYVDTPATIAVGLDYKIAIGGTCFSAKTNTIGIEESLLEKVTVSPVPFGDRITVNLPEGLQSNEVRLELFDASGRELEIITRINTLQKMQIESLKGLPSGVYILNLTANNKTRSFKLTH